MARPHKQSVVSRDYAGALPLPTRSLCPECKRTLPATIYKKDERVNITRTCPEHGTFDEIYWEDAPYYKRFSKYATPNKGLDTKNVGTLEQSNGTNCPYDCGLCQNHHSHTALANIAVTNRCDLSCWYCFYYAKEGDPIYEPDLKSLRMMLQNLRDEQPVGCNAIQLTGGEPTLRQDLPEIVKIAREVGFEHVQLNTTGMAIGRDLELAKKVKEAGVNTLYMSFDGTTPQTNPKNHWEAPHALENAKQAGLGVVLVPTLIRTVNDHDIGNMINFGLNHLDVVRSVNFQPVSLVGRMPKKLREKQRITIPGAIKAIEEQTEGRITTEDFYPIPCVSPVTQFVEALTGKSQYELSVHFACGAATYLYMENGKPVPIPQFVDIPGLFEYLTEQSQHLEGGGSKILSGARTLFKINSFIDKRKQPKDLNLGKLLFNALVKHNYDALGKIHEKTLLVGMMHFMDPYNYDQMRVERCDIHYAMPDGRIIPFCAFNVIPELYRDKVQGQYSISWEEWQKQNPGKDPGHKYRRDAEKLKENPVYQKYYDIPSVFTRRSQARTRAVK